MSAGERRRLRDLSGDLAGIFSRTLNSEALIGLSALFLSLTVALISAVLAWIGPQVRIFRIDDLMLYRDGQVVVLAAKIPLINDANAQFGDTVTQYTATLLDRDGRAIATFRGDQRIQALAIDQSRAMAERCDLDARCLALEKLLLIERELTLLDLPGASSRTDYIAYPLTGWNCTGPEKACVQFVSYDATPNRLPQPIENRRRLRIEFGVETSRDGRKRRLCTIDPRELAPSDPRATPQDRAGRLAISNRYFNRWNWTSMKCAH